MTLPLLALRGMMVFPGMIINLDVGREKSIAAVEAAMEGDRRLLLVTQKDAALTDVQPEDLYKFGALAEVKQLLKLPNGAIRILVEGLERVEYVSITDSATEKV
ncbi:MAG: LON peptidase substrate-binding domain-containing protein, partial [Phascolarctobacterium sp.]|nr:LON peptidase substrate-binding domain-containing protein [Phascolarctobacterium sp.]